MESEVSEPHIELEGIGEVSLPNEQLADHLYKIYKYYELENDTYRAKTFLEASEKVRIFPDPITSGQDAKEPDIEL